MPQVDIKYTNGLAVDIPGLLSEIQAAINEWDPKAGVCKCRVYKADCYQNENVLVNIAVLKKPHRDAEFMQALLKRIDSILSHQIPTHCYGSVQLHFLSDYYVTSQGM